MKTKIKVEKEVEIKTLHVEAGARYWEDSNVNGEQDENGDLIPCREGDYWKPIIDVDSGQILNWTKGVTAELHYKVCDDGNYHLKDAEGNTVISITDCYVPKTMSPKEKGYGDYIIMDIDENGFIADWEFDMSDFIDEEE